MMSDQRIKTEMFDMKYGPRFGVLKDKLEHAKVVVKLDENKYADIDAIEVCKAVYKCFEEFTGDVESQFDAYEISYGYEYNDLPLKAVIRFCDLIPIMEIGISGLQTISGIYTFLCLPVTIRKNDEVIFSDSLFKYDTEYDNIYYNKAPREIAQYIMDTVIATVRKILSDAKLAKDGYVKLKENTDKYEKIINILDTCNDYEMRNTIISLLLNRNGRYGTKAATTNLYDFIKQLKKYLKSYYVDNDATAAKWIFDTAAKVVAISTQYQETDGRIYVHTFVKNEVFRSSCVKFDIDNSTKKYEGLANKCEEVDDTYESIIRINFTLWTIWNTMVEAISTMEDSIKDTVCKIPYSSTYYYFKDTSTGFKYITAGEYRRGVFRKSYKDIVRHMDHLTQNKIGERVMIQNENLYSANYFLSHIYDKMESDDIGDLLLDIVKPYTMYYQDDEDRYQLVYPTTKHYGKVVEASIIGCPSDTAIKNIADICGSDVADYIQEFATLFAMIRINYN